MKIFNQLDTHIKGKAGRKLQGAHAQIMHIKQPTNLSCPLASSIMLSIKAPKILTFPLYPHIRYFPSLWHFIYLHCFIKIFQVIICYKARRRQRYRIQNIHPLSTCQLLPFCLQKFISSIKSPH